MFDRFLRQITVRRRIVGGVLIFVILLSLSIPLIINLQSFIVGRLQQVTEVEAKADRLLLLASARVASSRVNLLRYTQDYAPSTYEAEDDVDQAIQLLGEAQNLIELPEQKDAANLLLIALEEYKMLIGQIEQARQEAEGQGAVQLEFQAYRLGNDISQRIELIVGDSETRVQTVNEEIVNDARLRLILIVSGSVLIIFLALIGGSIYERSITRPIAELNAGAEAFRVGEFATRIPVVGTDELSHLADTFNQMAEQLSDLYRELEQRVIDRTQDLELRSKYLLASGQVAQAASSILDRNELMQQAVELIREHFELYYVGLFTIDEIAEWAILQAGTGEAGMAMLARQHRLQIGGGSMIGWSIENAQARISLVAGEDPVQLATEELPDTRSEAAIPMRARGRVIGALTVQSDQPNAFNDDSIVALQTMTDQVGVSLDNAQLFTEVQESLANTRRAYGEVSEELWQDLSKRRLDLSFRSSESGVQQIDQQDALPEALLALDKGEFVVGNVDGGQSKQTLAIPIKVRGNVIGVLDAHKPETEIWTEDEIELIGSLTEQLGIALDSAQLFEQTQQRAIREQMTAEITAQLRETLDIETVLKTATRELRKSLNLAEVEIKLASLEGQSNKPLID
ncbi:MAG: GAF domain-containing protein [Anaerolineales bacterium]|nr:GAF domain-containing protein [Chloroflexota bacterium]MBL6979736.1 GAF domain-containing protein [Anaerolineales bacterium]